MTEYTFATLDKWTLKTKRRMDIVVKQATSNMLADIPIKPGTTRGGARTRGMIARDTGTLANSLVSTLWGSTSMTATGPDSFVMIAGGMQAGDVARFAWGGPASAYVRAQHDGTGSMAGTFWITAAADKWPGYVRDAVAEAKARLP